MRKEYQRVQVRIRRVEEASTELFRQAEGYVGVSIGHAGRQQRLSLLGAAREYANAVRVLSGRNR